MLVVPAEMAHEAGGADGSPQHTPSPPHAPRLPAADTTFHHQIMQVYSHYTTPAHYICKLLCTSYFHLKLAEDNDFVRGDVWSSAFNFFVFEPL